MVDPNPIHPSIHLLLLLLGKLLIRKIQQRTLHILMAHIRLHRSHTLSTLDFLQGIL